LDISGSEKYPVVGYYVHGDKSSYSVRDGNVFVKAKAVPPHATKALGGEAV
jgi:hypothetical protein